MQRERAHALAVAAAGSNAVLKQRAAASLVSLYSLAEQEAAAKNAFAVRASEARTLLYQLHGARFVLPDAVTRVAAPCQWSRT